MIAADLFYLVSARGAFVRALFPIRVTACTNKEHEFVLLTNLAQCKRTTNQKLCMHGINVTVLGGRRRINNRKHCRRKCHTCRADLGRYRTSGFLHKLIHISYRGVSIIAYSIVDCAGSNLQFVALFRFFLFLQLIQLQFRGVTTEQ